MGRIFEQVRQRPLFLIEREIGSGQADAGGTEENESAAREPTAGP